MFDNQPKGLYALALANTGERFGYYTMLAVFALFLRANFGLSAGSAGMIYASFLGFVYFLPLIGGILADKIGYGKCVTIGIIIMFLGYLLLAIPLGGVDNGSIALPMTAMFTALVLISLGTGLFKGNLQVMVGNLYDDPKYADRRDAAFSLFYMAINIGAMFAPTAAVKIMAWAQESLGYSVNDSYHFAFMVACASLVLSIAIYYACRPWFKHVEHTVKQQAAAGQKVEELTPEQTKKRIIALCLVFTVVLFFWMAFHQNGLTLTYFANEFVNPLVTGVQTMAFDIMNLVLVAVLVYVLFGLFGEGSGKAKMIWGIVGVVVLGALGYKYMNHPAELGISAPIFQQFNPFYVVALTPVSMAIFGALAKRGKEPSAPRKIAYGMLVAGLAYVFMALCSVNLLSPAEQELARVSGNASFVDANVLILTYLILTFGELLLSPMGISFVSKVAPPQYKGMMMGLWFVATALGNILVSVGGFLWGELPLWLVWTVFVGVCAVAAIFMFSIMKKLEDATK
ncbi:MAG: peptide MFS transporter [Paludibacteraceae bacterium]|nr:peptide MFS transporter [Paludibacteraceae bacterium]